MTENNKLAAPEATRGEANVEASALQGQLSGKGVASQQLILSLNQLRQPVPNRPSDEESYENRY